MKRFVHALGNAFLTILVILLIVYGWVFIEIKLLLKPQPELFGFVFFQTNDESMMPEFESTDVIVVKKNEQFKAGDIILYFDGEDSHYKAQYVVSTDSSKTVTRCASCDTNNAPVSNNNIIGKAVGKVLFMGVIVAFFKQKAVLVTIGVVGVVLLVVSQYIEYKPNKKRLEEKQRAVAEKNVANSQGN